MLGLVPFHPLGKAAPVLAQRRIEPLFGRMVEDPAFHAALHGHIERGTLGFTVTQPTPPPASSSPTPAASPEATASPVSGTATPAATTAPTQPAAATPSPPAAPPVAQPEPVAADASGTDVLLPIALGLVLVAGVGLFVLRRSRNA